MYSHDPRADCPNGGTEISDWSARSLLKQAGIDCLIAACLIKMGEVAFSNAYDEGQKMTLDEAIVYALEM